jgi:hypothetical protein
LQKWRLIKGGLLYKILEKNGRSKGQNSKHNRNQKKGSQKVKTVNITEIKIMVGQNSKHNRNQKNGRSKGQNSKHN